MKISPSLSSWSLQRQLPELPDINRRQNEGLPASTNGETAKTLDAWRASQYVQEASTLIFLCVLCVTDSTGSPIYYRQTFQVRNLVWRKKMVISDCFRL